MLSRLRSQYFVFAIGLASLLAVSILNETAGNDEAKIIFAQADGKVRFEDLPRMRVPFSPRAAVLAQEAWADGIGAKVAETNGVGLRMVLIPLGQFVMGSPKSEAGRTTWENPVDVKIARLFRISDTEITQAQWRTVMDTAPWQGRSEVREGNDYPAVYVDWKMANEFCDRLTRMELEAGGIASEDLYRLPTEAEWEYSCRAGSAKAYCFGENPAALADFAWYRINAMDPGENYAHQVGLKQPNAWGLYDMHGNAGEWCQDWFDAVLQGGLDPIGPASGKWLMNRGLNWAETAVRIRSASRNVTGADHAGPHMGFRVVRTLAPNR